MNESHKIILSNDDLKNIQIMIDYLLDSEKTHYEENIGTNFKENLTKSIDNDDFILSKEFYNRPEINHIYAITQRLKDSIDLQL